MTLINLSSEGKNFKSVIYSFVRLLVRNLLYKRLIRLVQYGHKRLLFSQKFTL